MGTCPRANRGRLDGDHRQTAAGDIGPPVTAGHCDLSAEELPREIAEIGERATASIYAAIQKTAHERIDAVEKEATSRVETAQRSLAEAFLEIERLEQAGDDAAETLQCAQDARHEAETHAARAEGQVEASNRELERAHLELEQVREVVASARAEAAELRGQLKASAGERS